MPDNDTAPAHAQPTAQAQPCNDDVHQTIATGPDGAHARIDLPPLFPEKIAGILTRVRGVRTLGPIEHEVDHAYGLGPNTIRVARPDLAALRRQFGDDTAELWYELANHQSLWAAALAGRSPQEAALIRAFLEMTDPDSVEQLFNEEVLPVFSVAAAVLGAYLRTIPPAPRVVRAGYDMACLLGALRAVRERPDSVHDLEYAVIYARDVLRFIAEQHPERHTLVEVR